MIHVIPFEPKHAVELAHAMSLLQVLEPSEYGRLLAHDPIAFSGECDGRIVGAAGIHPLHHGVGRAWALLTDEVRAARFFLHREIKLRLPTLIEVGKFHRVECVVADSYTAAHRWAERLGFTHEGILHGYGPDGSDYHSYAIVTKKGA